MSEPADQLFVINHYTESPEILKNLIQDSTSNILIISSHALFDEELAKYKKAFPCLNISFKQFDSWNFYLEEEELDKRAFGKVRKWLKYTSIYQREFLDSVTFLKNEFLHQRMLMENLINSKTSVTVLCQSFDLMNLGISYTYWKYVGAKMVNQGPLNSFFLFRKKMTSNMCVRYPIYLLKSFLLAFYPILVTKIVDEENQFYVISKKRIVIKPNLIQSRKLVLPVLVNLSKRYLACPIHSSTNMNSMYPFVKRNKMVLIQDAFRPTSYPPYYYALSFYGSKLVPKSNIDKAFFENAGINCFPLNTLISNQLLLEGDVSKKKNIKYVCLTLNHSGNWSSLISRADTDGLIIAIAKVARKFEQISFIIRVHPNSDDLKGEGEGWKSRIRKQIQLMNHENIEVSNLKLEEDWKRAQVFVSEYSLSAVDALKYGKLVCFLNFTGRRSFVRDLTDVGFMEAESINEFEELLSGMLIQPDTARAKLRFAIRNFNQQYMYQ